MSENLNKERMLELLADQAIFGLSETETEELRVLEDRFPELSEESLSFEKAASAISLSNLDVKMEMPHNLQVKVLADADKYFESIKPVENNKQKEVVSTVNTGSFTNSVEASSMGVVSEKASTPFWQWLTPVFAGIGCIALLASIWINYNRPTVGTEITGDPKPTIQTPEPSLLEKRQEFMASAKDIIKTNWTSPDKNEELSGEVVWSNTEQKGYMTFRGLSENDKDKESYQLWIFDENQDEKTPIDGGVFDIDKTGEVVIPIDAKINVKKPKMFAVTVEKPGGVVVSKREKIVALAKI